MPALSQVDTQAQHGPPHQEPARLRADGAAVPALRQLPQEHGLAQQAYARLPRHFQEALNLNN